MPWSRARALAGIGRLRSGGSTVLLVTHELDLLQSACDEIWWLDAGVLEKRGDPARGAGRLSRNKVSQRKVRAWARPLKSPLAAAMRRGDGRARFCRLKLWAPSGNSTRGLAAERARNAAVRVTVALLTMLWKTPVIGHDSHSHRPGRFTAHNTATGEGEQRALARRGARMQIEFAFRCIYAPAKYTITAASHDADGTAHDWVRRMRIAVLWPNARYTAGVANLRAQVKITSVPDECRRDSR